MARIPLDSSVGTQRAIEDLNDEIRSLKTSLSRLSNDTFSRSLESIQKDLEMLKHLRRIPAYGQRAFTGSGRLFLDDSLNWSDVFGEVGVSSVSSSRDITGSDYILLVDASSGDVTLTLPAASLIKGRMLEVKKIDSTVNKVIIDAAGSDVIDGDATLELLYQDEAVPIVSDGVSEWDVL